MVADQEVTCAARKGEAGFVLVSCWLGRPGLRLRVRASGFVRCGSGVRS